MATKGLEKSANFPKIVKVTAPSNKYCKKLFRLGKRKGQEGEFFSHGKTNYYFFRFLRNLRPSCRPSWSSLEISLRFENCEGERYQTICRFRKPLTASAIVWKIMIKVWKPKETIKDLSCHRIETESLRHCPRAFLKKCKLFFISVNKIPYEETDLPKKADCC